MYLIDLTLTKQLSFFNETPVDEADLSHVYQAITSFFNSDLVF